MELTGGATHRHCDEQAPCHRSQEPPQGELKPQFVATGLNQAGCRCMRRASTRHDWRIAGRTPPHCGADCCVVTGSTPSQRSVWCCFRSADELTTGRQYPLHLLSPLKPPTSVVTPGGAVLFSQQLPLSSNWWTGRQYPLHLLGPLKPSKSTRRYSPVYSVNDELTTAGFSPRAPPEPVEVYVSKSTPRYSHIE